MPPVPRLQITERRSADRQARRRRRGQLRLGGLTVVVVVILIIAAAAGGHGHPRTRKLIASTQAKPRSAGVPTQAAAVNPLTTQAMGRLLRRRQGTASIAVEDLRTGHEWVLRPGARDQTASIVKANILETLLDQAQVSHTPLADVESDSAEEMIDASDNDDASALWDQIGGESGLDAYDDKIGMDQTSGAADGYWGETLTSAADQIRLLRQLSVTPSLLDAAAIRYQLGLMEDIDPGENWGVTGGVPSSGVTVALKDGWVPLSSNTDWQVNSIGWVRGDQHDYLIAMLTAHDPSEGYGISTLDAASKLIYDALGPAPKAGTPTITVTPSG